MAVIIIPKEDGTDLRTRIGKMSCRELYDLDDIKNTLNLTVAEALKIATAHINLRGIRYRVARNSSTPHSFVSELIKILNIGFSKQKLPFLAKTISFAESKKRHIDNKRCFLVVASSQKHQHTYSEFTDCYGVTDAEVLVRLEIEECEMSKTTKNQTEDFMIVDCQIDNTNYCVRDFVNVAEYTKHFLTEIALETVKKIQFDASETYFASVSNEAYLKSLGKGGSERYGKTVDFFKRLITISEQYIEDMKKV